MTWLWQITKITFQQELGLKNLDSRIVEEHQISSD